MRRKIAVMFQWTQCGCFDMETHEMSLMLHQLSPSFFCHCCPDDLTRLHAARVSLQPSFTGCDMWEGIIPDLPPRHYLLPLHSPVSALGEQRRQTEKRFICSRRRNRLHPEIAAADNGAQPSSHYCTRVWSEPTGRETDTFLISDTSGESRGNEYKSHFSRPVLWRSPCWNVC